MQRARRRNGHRPSPSDPPRQAAGKRRRCMPQASGATRSRSGSYGSRAISTQAGTLAASLTALSTRASDAAQDELVVERVADRELVLADALESVAGIEPLRTQILRPHPDPQRARAVFL